MSKTSQIPVTPVYPKVYHAFDRPKGQGLKPKAGEGRTQQQFKDECDVNLIVAKYTRTGLWSESMKAPTTQPMWGDFTQVPDFHEAQNILAETSQLFDALPSGIRKRFNNNPAELLEFVSKEENYAEAVTLGICNKRDVPATGTEKTETPKT